ncbi:4-coumarate--CoA ligase 3-like [Zerene cesonia]|uniref:4-coumarate--CoA ligase 3-like n=1 Tax=Zerene cesonia TaxID=33412 RepID=UPI0018E56194|nr:4-coumarate--CoA ligase 3-like [Zerene cesonia]
MSIDADTNKKTTFSELAQLSVDIALSLKRLNVGVGDVVSICCDKRMEFMPTVVGILCTGAAFSAADNSMLDENILYRLNITKPKVLFLSKDAYEKHQATLRKVDYIKHTIVYTDEHIGPMSFKEFLTEHAPIEDFEATPVEGWKDIAIIQFSSGTTGMPKAAIFTHKSFMMVTGTALCDQM